MKKFLLVLIIMMSLLFVLFLLQNTTSYQTRFLWFSGEVPASVLMVLTGVGGFILGILSVLLGLKNKKLNLSKEYTERTFRTR